VGDGRVAVNPAKALPPGLSRLRPAAASRSLARADRRETSVAADLKSAPARRRRDPSFASRLGISRAPIHRVKRLLRSKSAGLVAAAMAASNETISLRWSCRRCWSNVCIPYWLVPLSIRSRISSVFSWFSM
jgi:hypothetical protein